MSGNGNTAGGGRAIVVTGAASGIGRATAEALVAQGARVLAVDLDGDRVEQAASELGSGAVGHVADVSVESEVQGAIATAVERFGRLDGIFNNAGVLGLISPVQEYPSDEFERVYRTNVLGVFYGMKHAVPELRRAGGGAILNTASTGGFIAAPDQSAYIASKHAVVGLTRTVALETGRDSISVNVLCPGMVDTPMLASVWEGRDSTTEEELQAEFAAFSATARPARPEEIGTAAAWLLTDRPVYMTGAVIPVDGAQTAQ